MREAAAVVALRAAGCVFAEEEARLLSSAAGSGGQLADLVARRVAGAPLEQVLGWAEFCGLRIGLEPGVFVPRQRTSLLVTAAAARVRPGAVVVDLCCGSGAVGLALASSCPVGELHACDLDPVAVHCARRNLSGVGGQVVEGDLYDALPPALRGRVDLLVANAPYVPRDEVGLLPREARQHEPALALDGGTDGLDVQRRIVGGAAAWLRPGGCLVLETSRRQAERSLVLLGQSGLRAEVQTCDETDATVVVGVL